MTDSLNIAAKDTAGPARPTAASSFLAISNDGEVDPTGLRLLGASSKRGQEGKIGFFGTGANYALAVLLRSGAQVHVFSGTRYLPITTKPVTFRGQSFQEIYIDGQHTGITTDLGPKWEVWMAVREFLCNAIDEGGHVVHRGDGIVPSGVEGRTTVYISAAQVDAVWAFWSNYFRLNEADTVIEKGKKWRILGKVDRKTRVYRRGILVYTSDVESAYDYDHDDIKISEERLAQDVNSFVWKAIDESHVKRNILQDVKPFEAQVPPYWSSASEDWVDAVDGRIVATEAQAAAFGDDLDDHDVLILPDSWVSVLKNVKGIRTPEKVFKRPSSVKPAKGIDGRYQMPKLQDALKVLSKVGINIDFDDVRVAATFEDPNTKGTVEHGKIWVLKGLSWNDLLTTLVSGWARKASNEEDTPGFLCKVVVDLIGMATKSRTS